jgi:hypothetical protein
VIKQWKYCENRDNRIWQESKGEQKQIRKVENNVVSFKTPILTTTLNVYGLNTSLKGRC